MKLKVIVLAAVEAEIVAADAVVEPTPFEVVSNTRFAFEAAVKPVTVPVLRRTVNLADVPVRAYEPPGPIALTVYSPTAEPPATVTVA